MYYVPHLLLGPAARGHVPRRILHGQARRANLKLHRRDSVTHTVHMSASTVHCLFVHVHALIYTIYCARIRSTCALFTVY